MDLDFHGKTALITGASMGIGRAAALNFARHGADVVLLDVDLRGLQQVEDQLRTYGVRAAAYECDISQVPGQ